ncbi:glycosyltransferase family 4 protein [Halorussus sp. MSC15.2]|uniref:glycosyltransferase family 4 protein n=1 Tax=Halorussus sp. MSC15.2 TaxID=2283638 RepID=UPI0013D8AE9E|nr:glycosyltransferase family 4 protein [Halorussus sp. MSC15.2]NEU58092.1 glycosyltransferase family 4 protein [Halorussus sp. MSC15.2]
MSDKFSAGDTSEGVSTTDEADSGSTTDAPDGVSTADAAESDPTVLGFTDLRPEELVGPLDAVDSGSRVLSFPEAGPAAKLVHSVVGGVRVLRESDVDAILLYNGTGVLGLVSVVLSRLFGVPLLLRVNGDIYRQHADRMRELWETDRYGRTAVFLIYHLLTRLTYLAASGYVTVSEDLRDRLDSESSYPDRTAVSAHNPVDASRFADSDGREAVCGVDLDGTRVLLTVTNLNYEGKYRGVVEIVEAVTDILAEREDVVYVVAGDGTYFERLARYVEANVPEEVAERILLPGYVEEVPPVFAAADVFVYKSYIDGYPNVVLEAQAAGLPVVANPDCGIDEQVADGETGTLVSAADQSAFADAVDRLLTDENLCARVGRSATERVRARNSNERVGRELLDAVARILRS